MTGLADALPADHEAAILVGRVWRRDAGGPSPALFRDGTVFDLSALAPTTSLLFEIDDLPARLREGSFDALGGLDEIGPPGADADLTLLAPCDLQAVKACGVTFAASLIERVIEERAGGDPAKADAIRSRLAAHVGASLEGVRPGSGAAARLKQALTAEGLWSQYLEVGIGPDAEIFTKAQPMSAVGWGAPVGVHPASSWSNPEPEIALAANSKGRAVGASLGNDVNLRDFEGRSALLLGKAKDNNASCAVGPFVRLFDDDFAMADVEQAVVRLEIEGRDGFSLAAESRMSEISRPPAALLAQTINENHQYPDGLMLFLGTMFAPVEDRGEKGRGFTHREGDRVVVSSPRLGALVNVVTTSDRAPPWTFGAGALMKNLAARGLLGNS
ncbi:fumarylacetoacetate hydrolase family protein [Amphiplicatus metriothermophilus]|uniref:Fumarylacetoacetate (FAA) hydrolase family protein n=1 Tax=Amphiplicatus metriothermophilus TaxID=1519374 RepID=A0A239PZA0_9PROT|nr:fumarylacetoacetate hydrolase family protein [Amphiplicatus metriothermophilus]MBB5518171.1 fumarylacetoacetate (FAA) hydrolase family protein [Amphiplicatus metriothermophilus]SNT75333.1 Fumarylacetoacetate (FAA) hydrolase family protein [Amphiplicatus metriothermophilus]